MTLTDDRRRKLLGAGLASLWLVAVLTIDWATAASFVPAVLCGVAPLIASAALPPAATAGFGIAAVALTTASIQWNDAWGTAQTWIRIGDVALVAAAAVVLAAVRTRREQQLARVSRIAEVAQRVVLPLVPTHVGPVAAAARYLSAAEDALVGGDLYDWFHSDQRICFIVGDVRGKGINAVEQAARVIRAFRQSAAGGAELGTAAAEMSAYIAPFLDDEEFVTAALVQVSGEQVALVSCGHPQPLLIAADGHARLVDLHPAYRSAWEASTSPSRCPGHRATGCCCTPTASVRPVTGMTSTFPCCLLHRCCTRVPSRPPSTTSSGKCVGTYPTAGSRTTWPFCCSRTPPAETSSSP